MSVSMAQSRGRSTREKSEAFYHTSCLKDVDVLGPALKDLTMHVGQKSKNPHKKLNMVTA